MTADPHTINSGPGEPLSAPESASGPLAGAWRPSEGLNGPQAGAQGFHPRRPTPSWAHTQPLDYDEAA